MNYIYCFTNLINGKKYIGSTTATPEHRLAQHLYHVNHETDRSKYPLYQAIKKYGIDNFKFEVLLSKDCSEEEIRNIEHDFIVKENTIAPNGYNQTDETIHPLMTEEIIQKVSKTKREQAKEVAMLTMDLQLIAIYRSATDCEESTGISSKQIAACCRGEQKSVKGYIFYNLDENGEYIIPEYRRLQYHGAVGTTQIQSRSKRVAKIDLNTGEFLAEYDTVALAARENNCDPSCISKVCRGKRNQTKGFGWIYVE